MYKLLVFLSVVGMYVLMNGESKFFESMGGKSHIVCQCRGLPLIPSHRPATIKLKCNMMYYVDQYGVQHEIENECSRKESFVCSNICCDLRLCKKCYDLFSVENITTVIPSTRSQDASRSVIQDDWINDEESNDIDVVDNIFNLFQNDDDIEGGN